MAEAGDSIHVRSILKKPVSEEDLKLPPLCKAAKDGNIEEVERLLTSATKKKYKEYLKKIKQGDYDNAEFVLDCDLMHGPNRRPLPLNVAVCSEQNEIAEMILQKAKTVIKPVRPGTYDEMVQAALDVAIRLENLPAVKMLLRYGAEAGTLGYKEPGPIMDLLDHGRHAKDKEHNEEFTLECLKLLIENGASAMTSSEGGVFPLFKACMLGYPGVIRYLLDQNAMFACPVRWDVSGASYHHITEVEAAMLFPPEEKAKECIDLFMEKYTMSFLVEMRFRNRKKLMEGRMIHAAIKSLKPVLVQYLLDKGAKWRAPMAESRKPQELLALFLEECDMTGRRREINHDVPTDEVVEDAGKMLQLMAVQGEDLNKRYHFVYEERSGEKTRKRMTPLEYCIISKTLIDAKTLFDVGMTIKEPVSEAVCLVTSITSASAKSIEILEIMLEKGLVNPNFIIPATGDDELDIDGLGLALCASACATSRIKNGCKRDMDPSDESRKLVENPLDVGRGCYTARTMKLLLKFGASVPSITEMDEMVRESPREFGWSSRKSRLPVLALCVINKANILYTAGLTSRSAFLHVINFYLRRFDLREFEHEAPESLADMAKKTVMRSMRRRDQDAAKSLKLPKELEAKLFFDQNKDDSFKEMELMDFLHCFSARKDDIPYEDSEGDDYDTEDDERIDLFEIDDNDYDSDEASDYSSDFEDVSDDEDDADDDDGKEKDASSPEDLSDGSYCVDHEDIAPRLPMDNDDYDFF